MEGLYLEIIPSISFETDFVKSEADFKNILDIRFNLILY